ncbi:MAG: hypothetical protein M3R00_09210, partial [Pseudomonadota bacterium]|nr:hypothetical protein [Pseudomonadota bacterium]
YTNAKLGAGTEHLAICKKIYELQQNSYVKTFVGTLLDEGADYLMQNPEYQAHHYEGGNAYYSSLSAQFFKPIHETLNEYGQTKDFARYTTLLKANHELVDVIKDNHQKGIQVTHNELCKKVDKLQSDKTVKSLSMQNVFKRFLGVLISLTVVGNVAWAFSGARNFFWQNAPKDILDKQTLNKQYLTEARTRKKQSSSVDAEAENQPEQPSDSPDVGHNSNNK